MWLFKKRERYGEYDPVSRLVSVIEDGVSGVNDKLSDILDILQNVDETITNLLTDIQTELESQGVNLEAMRNVMEAQKELEHELAENDAQMRHDEMVNSEYLDRPEWGDQ